MRVVLAPPFLNFTKFARFKKTTEERSSKQGCRTAWS